MIKLKIKKRAEETSIGGKKMEEHDDQE